MTCLAWLGISHRRSAGAESAANAGRATTSWRRVAAEAERVMDQMARGDTFLTDVVGKKARSAVKPRHD